MRSRVAVTLVLLAAACGGSGSKSTPASNGATSASSVPTSAAAIGDQSGPCGGTSTPPPTYDHVIWIWMENHTADEVIGNQGAPYETDLVNQCGTATHYSQVGSPSLPNYIGATSGDTHGIADDAGPASHPITSDNIFRQVRTSGRTTRSYMEGMPGACALQSSGRYAVKHNPAPYYVGDDDRRACTVENVPLGDTSRGALIDDLNAGTLPAFSFVTPDTCNDTHDCPVSTGDKWLAQWLEVVLNSSTYKQHRTAVFVIWDEDTPMPNIIVSPTTPRGSRSDEAVDHYSLLRTTEEILNLPFLGTAASAASMRPPFNL
jgi:hypothetical protein